jgi:hypothetical protein
MNLSYQAQRKEKKEAAKTNDPGGLVGRFGLLPPDLNLQK